MVILGRPFMFPCWRKPAPHSQTIMSQYGVTVTYWGTPQWAGEGAEWVNNTRQHHHWGWGTGVWLDSR